MPSSRIPAKTTYITSSFRRSYIKSKKWFSDGMMDGITTPRTTPKEKGSTSSRRKSSTSSSNCRWTNERHLLFLNSIEASFVEAMFENNGRFDLRLDRHIPDSSESTQDLPNQRRRRCSTSAAEEPSTRTSKKNKRLISKDQVVPQVEIRRDNEDDKENVDESI